MRSTKSALGGWLAIIGYLVFPFLGFALHYVMDGRTAMEAELYIWAIYGLSPLIILFSILLIWNMVTAPIRIDRQRHREQLEKTIAAKDKELQSLKKENSALLAILNHHGIKIGKEETGKNANGKYTILPNGDLVCRGEVVLDSLTDSTKEIFISFPALFIEEPNINFFPEGIIQLVDVKKQGMVLIKVKQSGPDAVKYVARGRFR